MICIQQSFHHILAPLPVGVEFPHHVRDKEQPQDREHDKQLDEDHRPQCPPQAGHLAKTIPVETENTNEHVAAHDVFVYTVYRKSNI